MTDSTILLRGVVETGVELWNDSCGPEDLACALANGATGATSNPPIVLGIVRAERGLWHARARALAAADPRLTEDGIAWRLLQEVASRGAALLEPVHARTGGRQGRLSAQVDPRRYRDAGGMLDQALQLFALAPNMQVKIPVTTAGLAAIEEATFRGVEVNATANFTVAGAIAVAEAVERGLDRRAAAGRGDAGDLHPVCTLMFGRLDDWVKAAADRDEVLLTPGRAEWAGVAVFKRSHHIYRERGYRTRLLGGAFRHHLPWSQLLGPDVILTIPPAWQHSINASGLAVEARLEEPVDAAIIDELLDRSPEFRLAYEPDGLADAALETYGAARRTLRQFLAAYADLGAEVRDAILPDPDRKPAAAARS
ncbi:MAG: transaldolase family protein [Chloroflexota bacterium]